LQKRFQNLRLHITLSRAEGTDWTGHKGRVSGEFLTSVVPELAKRPVYICGPTAMMSPTIQLLRDLGVPAENIKMEEFIAAKRTEGGASIATITPKIVALPDDGTKPTLTFSRSGKTVALDPDKCLLEIAEEAGVNVDFECRSGICGRCKTRLLGGGVTMETQDALSDDDKSRGVILMCQARASRPVTVDA